MLSRARVEHFLKTFAIGAIAASLGIATMGVILVQKPARAASTYPLGVDVSHWQGQINWTKVAGSGHVFAIHKATEGTTFIDNMYSTNRKGAAANGIKFGAYHFANPTGSTSAAAAAEAVMEADHFVEVAAPIPGDLIPALDIETSKYTQAMPTNRLIDWVDAWLAEVKAKVGVNPMIYTSPNFWQTKFGDTTHFADEGYTTVWVAHWTSHAQPTVPAQDWGGNDWTFWQYTDCATVPGISNCVDADRYKNDDFTPVTIPGAVSPTPSPSPTGIPPSNSSPPTISGDAEVGSTLTASSGTWDGTPPISYTYAWYRCDSAGANCSGVPNGTEPTYTLASDDYGHAMKVTVTGTNAAGSGQSSSAPTSVVTDATPPAEPTMNSLPAFTSSRHVDVRWEEQGGATAYELRDRRASYNSGFGPYHQDGSSTETSFANFGGTPGNTYCFSARAVDEAGNVSGWSKPTCTAIPLDDRALVASAGWKRSRSSRSYLSTYTATSRRLASLTLTGIKAHRLALIAQRCRGCGEIRVSVNGARIQDVKLAAAHTEDRKIIRLGYFPRVEKGTITIEVISSGKPVRIDGLGVGRI